MNLASYSLDNKKVIYFFLVILLVGGIIAFFDLAKKEDSPFIIKQSVLITQYPGATPEEVEQLITEPIEREIQSMSDVYKVKSESYFGLSKITIELDPSLKPDIIPIKWDELRRKVLNIQPNLPSGASSIVVNDDFGDVFGIYYALAAGDGFTYAEMRDWAQRIKRELVPIDGVQKVFLSGEQTQVVNVFVSASKLSNMEINPNEIMQVIQTQNLLVKTGDITAGSLQLQILADGTYKSLEDIRNQIFITRNGMEVRLGDVADIERGYMDPPSSLMRVDGQKAIGIGVATGAKDDVVKVGDMVKETLDNLRPMMPVGMELLTIYPENEIAREANNGFILNLIESLLIVIVVILMVMGVRAGMLIGSSLLFSIGGTLLIMLLIGVGLNRTSLAAFIIAMGMLVDNAIVVTDNAQIGIKKGLSKRKALIEGATIPQWGLLGATLIAVCSFLPMYLAPSSVAEIVKPLFIVLAVSLGLSWLLALTQTTSFGEFMLKANDSGTVSDPYDTRFYHRFGKILRGMIKYRWLTLGSAVGLLILSLYIMGIMPQSFFPYMDKPYMRADVFFPEGYSIKDVEKNMKEIESWIMDQPEVKSVSITMGGSPVRYYLASTSYGPKPNFANILVETYESKESPLIEERLNSYVNGNYPDLLARSSLFMLSPAVDANIEIGFIGADIDTLQMLTEQVKNIMRRNEAVTNVRDSWGNKVPVYVPQFSQEKGLRLGITRQQMAYTLRYATNGLPIGEYREGDLFMPIFMKDNRINRFDIQNIRTLPVYSTKGGNVSLEQVIDEFEVQYKYNVIKRYNRERVMMAQCDTKRGQNTMAAFKELWSEVQKEIVVPEGYEMKYFGEQDSQDESNKALAKNIPLTFMIIFVTLLLLFPKSYRKPTVIMLMLPLIFIGIVFGLLVMGKSLDFFATLGLLGLIGMNIKNAIVLVDQIGIEGKAGLAPLEAVVQATKSRIVPVTMASGTTILGMLPLLSDAMFGGMAATIMGGLFVATMLTIFILPVTYCVFFRIKS
ncbi:MAG: efflux RND transporter permease subunit [Bacteroidales bacterium]|nr:efflux RND transporter permease subunit [Bacteroidales bacterium]